MEIVQSNPIANNTYAVRITCSPNRGPVSFSTSYGSYFYSDESPSAIESHWAREMLTFSGQVLGAPGLRIVDWEWDLGEGTRKSGQTITHVYTVAMPVVVHLRVRADNGFIGTASLNIMLKEGEPNILLNPYGASAVIDPWVPGGDLFMEPEVPEDEVKSLQAMPPGGPSGYLQGFKITKDESSSCRISQAVLLANGNRYRLSGWVYASGISATTRVELINPSSTLVAANQTTSIGNWTLLSTEYNVNTTGSHLFRIKVDFGSGGGVLSYTNLRLELLSTWL